MILAYYGKYKKALGIGISGTYIVEGETFFRKSILADQLEHSGRDKEKKDF